MSVLQLQVSVSVLVLLVCVPFSVSLTTQWLYGWPNKPGYRKYVEALKPRRVFCLTGAVLETLKYLQYGRLYLRLKSWYRNQENNKHYEKGITFGRRGNKLDLYYPPSRKASAPLVVFVFGGAWGSGDRSTYCLLARNMSEELNAAVVCPDYCTYPKGNVLGMVQDIADCLVWAQHNGHKFNFDKDNVVLVGHSAGAHLCSLATLFLVDGRHELFITDREQRDVVQALRGVIGLSGVYDIQDHYEHEQKRAVEFVSTMHKAMNGAENFQYYSPTHSVKSLSPDKLSRVPPFVLIHGTSDIIVPVESSVKFSDVLTSLSVKVSLFLIPGVSHTEVVTDLMTPDRRYYDLIYSCIKQQHQKLLDS